MIKRLSLILTTLVIFGLLLAACAPAEQDGVPGTGDEEIIPGTPPGDPQASPGAATDELLLTGEQVYADQCAFCHQPDGSGGAFPPLAGNPVVIGEDPTPVINLIVHGRDGEHAFGPSLDDADIASVITYIRNTWGNNAPAVTPEQVEAVRAQQ